MIGSIGMTRLQSHLYLNRLSTLCLSTGKSLEGQEDSNFDTSVAGLIRSFRNSKAGGKILVIGSTKQEAQFFINGILAKKDSATSCIEAEGAQGPIEREHYRSAYAYVILLPSVGMLSAGWSHSLMSALQPIFFDNTIQIEKPILVGNSPSLLFAIMAVYEQWCSQNCFVPAKDAREENSHSHHASLIDYSRLYNVNLAGDEFITFHRTDLAEEVKAKVVKLNADGPHQMAAYVSNDGVGDYSEKQIKELFQALDHLRAKGHNSIYVHHRVLATYFAQLLTPASLYDTSGMI